MSERDELAAIWRDGRTLILARLEVLDRAAAALESGPLDADLRRQARDEAHTLAGTAAIFGLAEAARLAKECERSLDADVPAGDAPRLRGLVRALREALERGPDRQE